MILIEFKALLDRAISLRQDRADATFSTVVFPDYRGLHERLRVLLGSGMHERQLRALQHELVVRHAAYDDQINPCFWIISLFRDALRPDTDAVPVHSPDWLAAIICALDNEKNCHAASMAPDFLERITTGPREIGKAVRTLRDAGFEVEVLNDDINVPEGVRMRLQAEFDELAKAVGGMQLLNAIFQTISSTRNPVTEHFQIVRHVSSNPEYVGSAQIPWGYLVQLGIKHSKIQRAKPCREALIRLIELATASVAIFGVQPFSIHDGMWIDQQSILKYLVDSIGYDAIFALPQLKGEHSKRMYHGLFTETQKTGLQGKGIKLSSAIRVADAIIAMADDEKCSQIFPHLVGVATGINMTQIAAIFDAGFIGDAKTPNHGLGYPPLATDIDSFLSPLLKVKNGVYVALPRSLTAYALLEALLTIARAADPGIDQHLGPAIERLLKEEFRKKNIVFKSGKYSFRPKTSVARNLESDCDLVLETQDKIIFVECKKKALTRPARSGDDVAILSDLSKSLVHSQAQALQHQWLLMDESEFSLTADEGVSTLSLNDRGVIRLSVSLLDYGSLQDTVTLQQFLDIGCRVSFSHSDATKQKQLDGISEKFALLRELGVKVKEFDPAEARSFYGSLFTSVPKLLLVLEHSHDAESFWKELGSTRSIVTGMRDFYADFSYWLGVRRKVELEKQRSVDSFPAERH